MIHVTKQIKSIIFPIRLASDHLWLWWMCSLNVTLLKKMKVLLRKSFQISFDWSEIEIWCRHLGNIWIYYFCFYWQSLVSIDSWVLFSRHVLLSSCYLVFPMKKEIWDVKHFATATRDTEIKYFYWISLKCL